MDTNNVLQLNLFAQQLESEIVAAGEKMISENKKPAGLMLVGAPTGYGKSTVACSIMAKFVRGEIFRNVNTIYYTTPRKNNLAEIEAKLIALGLSESIIRIPSDVEAVSNAFSNPNLSIPESLTATEEYKNLEHVLDLLDAKNSSLVNDEFFGAQVSDCVNRWNTKVSNLFNQSLNNGKTSGPYELLKDDEWKWLRKAYPLVDLLCRFHEGKKTIVLTTTLKFYSFNNPIIASRFRFCDPDCHLLDNSINFRDEIDSEKVELLDAMIENSRSGNVDFLEQLALFANPTRQLPDELFKMPKNCNRIASKDIYSSFRKRIEKTNSELHLDRFLKFEGRSSEDRGYLFQSPRKITVIKNGKGQTIGFSHDGQDKNVHVLRWGATSNKEFFEFMYRTKSDFDAMLRAINSLALNYWEAENEERLNHPSTSFTYSNAVYSVLDMLGLDKRLAPNVLAYHRKHAKSAFTFLNWDFYSEGLATYPLSDADDHNGTTKINCAQLNETPEGYLATLCSRTAVIGLSATSQFKTVTGNYDLDYIEKKLASEKISVFKVPESESDEIGKKLTEDKKRYKADTTIIKSPNQSHEMAKGLFESEKNVKEGETKLKEIASLLGGGQRGSYNMKRVYKWLLAIKCFFKNPDGHSLLIFTNMAYLKDSSRKAIFENLIDRLAEEAGIGYHKYLLYGSDFDDLARFKNEAADNKKSLLFTTFSSGATGQNYQYEIDGIQHDVDSIFMEKPTNFLVNTVVADRQLTEKNREAAIIKYVYQTEALMLNGELSEASGEALEKSGIQHLLGNGGRAPRKDERYDTDSAHLHMLRDVYQAFGRTCRTPLPESGNVTTNVYLDSDVVGCLPLARGYVLHPKFMAMLDSIQVAEDNQAAGKAEIHKRANRAINATRQCLAKIEGMRHNFTVESMGFWKDMGKYALAHPTISENEVDPRFRLLYAPSLNEEPTDRNFSNYDPRVDSAAEDFAFSPKKDKGHIYEVSSDTAKLSNLLSCDPFRKHMEQKGFATEFEKNDLVLNPAAFQRIYLRALGEEFVSFYFEKELNVKLEELDDPAIFERFDFHFGDIYVDAKYFSAETAAAYQSNLSKIERKATDVKAKAVFIVNVLPNDLATLTRSGKVYAFSHLLKNQSGAFAIDEKTLEMLFEAIKEEKK